MEVSARHRWQHQMAFYNGGKCYCYVKINLQYVYILLLSSVNYLNIYHIISLKLINVHQAKVMYLCFGNSSKDASTICASRIHIFFKLLIH